MKLILLDRGDRPNLTEWVLNRFKNHDIIHPDFAPVGEAKDIVRRLRAGLAEAGDDFVYLIENDDYYPADYIEKMESERIRTNADWIGDTGPTYYHLPSRTYQHYKNMGVSGLWSMGFNTRIMDTIKWLNDGNQSMDSHISRHVKTVSWVNVVEFSGHGGIGIKGHGVGMNGSASHGVKLENNDPVLDWLISRTDQSFINLHSKFF